MAKIETFIKNYSKQKAVIVQDSISYVAVQRKNTINLMGMNPTGKQYYKNIPQTKFPSALYIADKVYAGFRVELPIVEDIFTITNVRNRTEWDGSRIQVRFHSGRTDMSGGHHDYKNVSRLGNYHFHHSQGPHLHPHNESSIKDEKLDLLEKILEYLDKSAKQIILGEFTDEVTLLGLAGEIAIGITPLGIVADTRDVIAAIEKKDILLIGVCLIAFIPVLGDIVKKHDEVATIIKRYGDEIGNGFKELFEKAKSSISDSEFFDAIENGITKAFDFIDDIFKKSDELGEILKPSKNATEVVQNITISRSSLKKIYAGMSELELDFIMSAHKEVLEHGLKNGTEMIIIFNKSDGKVLVRKTGSAGSVKFDASALSKCPDDSVVLVHNHPGGSAFSPADIAVFNTNSAIKSISVQGHNGKMYTLSLGSGKKWPTNKTLKNIKIFFDDAIDKLGKNSETIILVNKHIAEKFGWIFKEE